MIRVVLTVWNKVKPPNPQPQGNRYKRQTLFSYRGLQSGYNTIATVLSTDGQIPLALYTALNGDDAPILLICLECPPCA